jgi:hypothetical protein
MFGHDLLKYSALFKAEGYFGNDMVAATADFSPYVIKAPGRSRCFNLGVGKDAVNATVPLPNMV